MTDDSEADDRAAARPGRGIPGLRALGGGVVGATVLVLLQVPAGGIVGAVAGSAVASGIRGHPKPHLSFRTIGLVLLGCAAGVRLELDTLAALLHLAVPLVGAVVALFLLDVALAFLLNRRYGVDPITALLACAPGGVSEMAVLADQANARVGLVISIHVVRVVTVVLIALPLLLLVLGQP